MDNNCKNCKHCKRKGIAYTSPGGSALLQDYRCDNERSQEFDRVITQVSGNDAKNDPREYNSCDKWERLY